MCYLLAAISFMPRGGDKDGEQMKEEKHFVFLMRLYLYLSSLLCLPKIT